MLFSVADATYDSPHIYETARAYNIFGKNLMKERRRIEQHFSKLKNKGIEQLR